MDKVCFNCPLSGNNKVEHLMQLFHLLKKMIYEAIRAVRGCTK